MTDRRPRNVPVDLARALAILIVVWFHLSYFQLAMTMGPGRSPHLTLTMRTVGPAGWIGSWFLQVMPLFFVAGGFANVQVVERVVREGHPYGHYLAERARRLIGPLTVYMGFVTITATVLAWLGQLPVAQYLSLMATRVLWFISAYLVIVLVAPLMVRAHDRWGVQVPIVLLAGALLVDAATFLTGDPEVRELNHLFVWLFAHQLGIGYARGWLRPGPAGSGIEGSGIEGSGIEGSGIADGPVGPPVVGQIGAGQIGSGRVGRHRVGRGQVLPGLVRRSLVIAASAAAGIVALLLLAPYPVSAVGIGDQDTSNLVPPTTPMALLALAEFALLALTEHLVGDRLRRAGWLQRVLAVVNALAMTIYLWHIPIIAAAVGLLLLPSMAVGHPIPFLLTTPMYWLVSIPLLIALVPLIGRVERALIPPLGARQSGRLALYGVALLLVGLEIIRRQGMVLHPQAPAATLGVLLFMVGAWSVRLASDLPASRRQLFHPRV
ncbi:acyltransferase [Raineyella sp. LH-20]|uniref:acyltransferase family protein n=1 Tax=Raineyella sp. LH-20 TaxID=3081204 RepID=UPI0029559C21|nr:acyltransferase [Raineyella sp. LH-20]WOP18480.1 acyltransferase [Raineyella sp. LH-20]